MQNPSFASDITLPAFLEATPPSTYLVGGSVRDLLTGSTPEDYDLCTDADPRRMADGIARTIGGRVVVLTKGEHVLYRAVNRSQCIDITGMKDNDILHDLRRRDFSINALAFSLDTREIIDPNGGLQDLEDRRIRMVSPQAFDDDPLRLLRAHRLAAGLGFQIDGATREVIGQKARKIQGVSGERIWNELGRIFAAATAHIHISAMSDNGLLTALFPELIPLKQCAPNRHHIHNAYDHSLAVMAAVESLLNAPDDHLPSRGAAFVGRIPDDQRVVIKLAGLLHDVGKPSRRRETADGEIHFHGHAAAGAAMLRPIARRLRMANRQSELLEALVRRHQDPLMLHLNRRQGHSASRATARFFRRNRRLSPLLLLHALADETAKTGTPSGQTCRTEAADFMRALLDDYFQTAAPIQNRPRLLDGNDLMALFGLPPSPLIGRLLKMIETAQLADEIHDRDEAMVWVASRLKQKE